MVGVAVKVTGVPWQMLVAEEAMPTEAVTEDSDVILSLLLVDVTGVAQPRLLVISTV